MHDKRGADHQAYLWQYGKPGGETVFDFCMGRGREGPQKFLGQWEGILQTDGYQAYDDIGGPKLVHVGCWAHARRKFVDAVKVNRDDGAAIQMVMRMDALFLVDRDAREKQMTRGGTSGGAARARRGVGGRDSPGMREAGATVLPKSALGKAVSYTLNQWPKLRRCFDYAEVELSNNLAENSMRPVALGRKNWLHVGSAKAGPKVAAILSIVESCRRLGVPVKEYLLDVLPGLDRRKLSEIALLTPAAGQRPAPDLPWFRHTLAVQRCRQHKLRNVAERLPKDQQAQTKSRMRAAWKLDAKEGITKLEKMAKWLEREHPDAADSLREGMEECFTINRMDIPPSLHRCLASTNLIENPHSGVRRRTRRVCRWRDKPMAKRWTLRPCWRPRRISVASWVTRTCGRSKRFLMANTRKLLTVARKLPKMLLPSLNHFHYSRACVGQTGGVIQVKVLSGAAVADRNRVLRASR